MPTNKHAIIRYHALDQCFSNPGRKYFIEDLIEACNNAIYEFTGVQDGVKRRQILYDIIFMESEQGWSIPLDKIKDGKRVFYRYSDKKFSIRNQAINESEATQIKETLTILNRFKGMPQFDWIEEILIRLESSFNLKSSTLPIVSFEQNPYLKGLNFFSDLFNAIHYKKVLDISYQGFKQDKSVKMIIHPYFLKQYNNRWFLFSLNEATNSISNLALDRIIDIKETRRKFIENETIDFEEYFEDIVGVTVYDNIKPTKVIIEISNDLYPYIKSKPIHGSQKIKGNSEKGVLIELFLQINYEFISLIFSYGEDLKVVEPEELKTIIKTKAEKLIQIYF